MEFLKVVCLCCLCCLTCVRVDAEDAAVAAGGDAVCQLGVDAGVSRCGGGRQNELPNVCCFTDGCIVLTSWKLGWVVVDV